MYTELGFDHILDPKGYDHILFVVALCALYVYKDWKRVLILVTAFTIGHSLTLALSTLKIISISKDLVEFLIPITIVLTCVYNILKGEEKGKLSWIHYILAIGFGLIHGLGFSNYLRAILGKEENIVGPLFYFNVGVELGQIVIVLATMLLSYILVDLIKIKQRYYNYALSVIIMLWALKMIFF